MKKTVFRIFCVFFALCLLSGCGKLQVERKDPHGSDSLRVMSFNVCGWNYKNVKHLAAKTILAYDADLVGLQECGYACYKGLMQDLEGYSFVGVGRENGRLDKNSGVAKISNCFGIFPVVKSVIKVLCFICCSFLSQWFIIGLFSTFCKGRQGNKDRVFWGSVVQCLYKNFRRKSERNADVQRRI